MSDLVDLLLSGGLGAAGLSLAAKGYEDLGDIGTKGYRELSGYTTEEGEFVPGLADKLSGMLEFQPYTVTSATGGRFGMSQDPESGEMSYNLATSPEEQAFQQQAMKDAEMFFGQARTPIAQREQAGVRPYAYGYVSRTRASKACSRGTNGLTGSIRHTDKHVRQNS